MATVAWLPGRVRPMAMARSCAIVPGLPAPPAGAGGVDAWISAAG